MIAECAADLLARVRSVSALVDRTGLSLGGHSIDPGLLKIPLPAAWVMYKGDKPDEAPYGDSAQGGGGIVPSSEVMLASWRVVVYVAYTDDADLLNIQFPLLEAVKTAIKTTVTTGPLGGVESPNGYSWRYIGEKLALVYNDRLAYEQYYTLQMVV